MAPPIATREMGSRATVLLLVDDSVWLPKSAQLLGSVAEASIEQALRRFAARVVVAPFADVDLLLRTLDDVVPDVVFNMTQNAHGDRRMDAHICAVLELRGVAYTGTGPRGLTLCRDKALSKAIALRAGFVVPEYFVVEDGPVRAQTALPLVVKPRFGDGSEGISQGSLVRTNAELTQQVEYLRSIGCIDIVCEEYVPGREFVVGIVGDRVILPPAEFIVGRNGPGAPVLACRRFKYDTGYRDEWAISMEFADLTPQQSAALVTPALRTYEALDIRGYGRLDVKLTPSGAWAFLEANPNPGLSPTGKTFAGASGGVEFEALIEEITLLALARSPRIAART
jgi:D-alanine-D-alanine ligase